MHHNRTFVAVVGGDGAGKTSVSTQLVEQLNALGHAARYLDRWDIVDNPAYPAASFLKNDVPHIRACVADMPNPARLLFLLWSMSLALSGERGRGAQREIVVMDGYWMKHAASETAYGLDPAWGMTVASALPPPDAVFHLRLSPEQAWSRKQGSLVPYECGMDPTCSEERFLNHQRRIHRLLDDWSTRFGWIGIDASRPLPDVVTAAVEHLLALPKHVASPR